MVGIFCSECYLNFLASYIAFCSLGHSPHRIHFSLDHKMTAAKLKIVLCIWIALMSQQNTSQL